MNLGSICLSLPTDDTNNQISFDFASGAKCTDVKTCLFPGALVQKENFKGK